MQINKLSSFFIPAINKGHTNGNKIMLVLHGLGDSLDSYKSFAQELNVTGLNFLLLNAPTPYFFGHSWYDIPPGNPTPGIDHSSNILLEVIKDVLEHGFCYEDIFLCGFSQGGCIALETFYKINKKIGGLIALSPRIYIDNVPELISNKEKLMSPIFVAHGKFDPVISYEDTLNGVRKIEDLGHQVTFNSYDMEHEIDIQEIMDLRFWLNEKL